MRLQDLIIIFVVIALPLIIILSVYIGYQVDTATLQASYDNKLVDATHDAIVAFEYNSTNNKYSALSDSMIRDVEAAINIFSSGLASNLGMNGASKSDIMSNVPAILFTLNDGYYIYTPTRDEENGTFSHSLKPYVYYTKEYRNGNKKMVINFSLDNYVAVYYYDLDNESFESRAGYLEVLTEDKDSTIGLYVKGEQDYNTKDGEYNSSGSITVKLPETIKYNGITIKETGNVETLKRNRRDYDYGVTPVGVTDTNPEEQTINAYQYYKEASEFTKWFNGKIIDITNNNSDSEIYKTLYINENNSPIQGAESSFNDEKIEVIKNTITNNLVQSMSIYRSVTSVDFKMPELTPLDWDTILNNVCIISFLQGLPLGTAVYNDYVILPSTENNLYVDNKSLYFIGDDDDDDVYYHRIGCEHIEGSNITRL